MATDSFCGSILAKRCQKTMTVIIPGCRVMDFPLMNAMQEAFSVSTPNRRPSS